MRKKGNEFSNLLISELGLKLKFNLGSSLYGL